MMILLTSKNELGARSESYLMVWHGMALITIVMTAYLVKNSAANYGTLKVFKYLDGLWKPMFLPLQVNREDNLVDRVFDGQFRITTFDVFGCAERGSNRHDFLGSWTRKATTKSLEQLYVWNA